MNIKVCMACGKTVQTDIYCLICRCEKMHNVYSVFVNFIKIKLKRSYLYFSKDCFIVQFQKISTPTPWKVNGNLEGVGGLKSQNFKKMVWGLTGSSRGVGDSNQKTFPGSRCILLTDLHKFSYSISWENLLKHQSNITLVIIL